MISKEQFWSWTTPIHDCPMLVTVKKRKSVKEVLKLWNHKVLGNGQDAVLSTYWLRTLFWRMFIKKLDFTLLDLQRHLPHQRVNSSYTNISGRKFSIVLKKVLSKILLISKHYKLEEELSCIQQYLKLFFDRGAAY